MDRKPEKKLVSFRLPEDLIQQLKERADQENTSVTELVCRFLNQGLQTSTDDRITKLEAEIQKLRQQPSPTNNVIPTPVYMLPPNLVNPDSDNEIKQRIANLEARMEKVVTSASSIPAYFAKLETLVEEVQTVCQEAQLGTANSTTTQTVCPVDPSSSSPDHPPE
ncbi:DUF6364 family protein [Pantanalinema rosaneae CENA516]|uniref:DUF6364 family protein n=1 Tax=Pantanalinema rosaneae TaxID=1620701 RepID=UPI003D6EC180